MEEIVRLITFASVVLAFIITSGFLIYIRMMIVKNCDHDWSTEYVTNKNGQKITVGYCCRKCGVYRGS